MSQTRLCEGKTLEVATTQWPHPHEPVLVWRRARSWKHGPTPEQLERARQRLLTTRKYFFRCKFCQELADSGWSYESDVCYGCATVHFGVLY
ncbi:hypothetical protein JST97_06680 [bacterium]|nr:hypothetical protein [bacterium]